MLLHRLRRAAIVLLAAASCGAFAAAPAKNKAPTVTLTSPVTGASFTPPATVQLSAIAADTDGTVAKVEFFRGTTLIATVSTAPYNFTWTGVAAGSYTITAKATDDAGATATSTAASITVAAPANAPPSVSLTSPSNGASYAAPATIQLTATASDTDGTIAKVEFFRGSTLIGTATSAPYTFTWSNVALGSYSITAKATDNAGGTATSSAAAVNVVSGSTLTTITSPTPTTLFDWPITDVSGTFSGTPDTTVLVSNGNNSTVLSTITGTTTFVAKNVLLSPGLNTLTATAIRRDGTSSAASVTVDVPQRLVVLTSPAQRGTYEMPPSVTFQASTLLSGGSVARVDYYRTYVGKLGSATTPPYTFQLNNPAKGTYNVYALLVDDKGVSRQSQEIQFNVVGPNLPPSVSLTAPAPNAVFAAPASFNLQATAADSDGTVNQVDFLRDGQLLGSTNVPPYSFAVSSLPSGTYTFVARAVDDKGASTTSAPVAVTVAAPPSVSMSMSASGGRVASGSSVTFSAAASGSSAIVRVDYFANSTPIGSATAAPFSFTWPNIALGEYALTARATDAAGLATTSTPLALSVVAGPNVSITAPAGGSNFFLPATINLAANASSTTGSIASVAFFQNGNLLGTVTSAPYSFVWNNAAAGSYAITAVATDAWGVASTSPGVNITVAGPSVVVDAPLPGAPVGPEGVLVRGRVTAPPYSGVTVNGTIAYVDAGGNFYANGVVPNASQITASVSTIDGLEATTTLSVTAAGTSTGVVTVENEEEIASVKPKFTFSSVNGIKQLDFDYIGSGTPTDSTANDPSFVMGRTEIKYMLMYSTPGVYRPIFRMTDMLGNVTTHQIAASVVDPAKLDAMLKALWARLLAKVRAGDIDAALTGVTAAGHDQYRRIFQNLQPDAATAVDQMGTLEAVSLSTDSAEYVVLRQKAEGLVGYPVFFIRDGDGVWRIDAM